MQTVSVGAPVIYNHKHEGQPSPYQIFSADLMQCPDCNTRVYKANQRSYAEHYDKDFDAMLEKALQHEYVVTMK